MANQIAELDEHLELLAQIADELEQQVAPCPTTRPMLIAWLTEWIRSPEALSEIRRELPRLDVGKWALVSAPSDQTMVRFMAFSIRWRPARASLLTPASLATA